jgi:hypothetical protein
MTSAWRKSSSELKGCRLLPPPPPPSTPCKSPRRLPPPSVGKNAHQDSSCPNNTLNSSSSPARRRITTTTAVAVAAVAPPTHLPPRVRGPPSSTPGSTLFKCGRVPGGTAPSNLTYVHRLCWPRPFPTAPTIGRATLHSTACTPARPSWSAASSSTSDTGDMVPMNGLVGSTVAGQLLQHHVHGPSYSHRLGG